MARLASVTFACSAPDSLASFWEAALDAERRPLPDGTGDDVLLAREAGAHLLFKAQPAGPREDLPIHLDLAVEDREAAERRFESLGASVRECRSETFNGDVNRWTVMEDPAGNGFCISEY